MTQVVKLKDFQQQMVQEPVMRLELEQALELASSQYATGDDANWDVARLTYEYTHEGAGRPSGEKKQQTLSMKEWAREIHQRSGRRFSERTAKRWKRAYTWKLEDKLESPEKELGQNGPITLLEAILQVIKAEDMATGTPEKLPTHTEVQDQVPPENVIDFKPSRPKPDIDFGKATTDEELDEMIAQCPTDDWQLSEEEIKDREDNDPDYAKWRGYDLQTRTQKFVEEYELFVWSVKQDMDKQVDFEEISLYWTREMLERMRSCQQQLETLLGSENKDTNRFLAKRKEVENHE